jgi:uncharacterized protein (TIGR02266 family)
MGDAARKLDVEEHEAPETRLDARVVPRTSVHVSVDLFSEHNFWTGLTMNVSEGGVFVATHAEAKPGTVLIVHLELPGSDEPIVTLAEVRWTRAFTDQDDVPPGLGLQFVALDAVSHAKIKRFVATVRDPLYFDDE